MSNFERLIESSSTQIERLRAMYAKYELISEDIFLLKMGGKSIPIITRTGIEKIQSKENIKLTYTTEHISQDCSSAVVKCVATLGDVTIESYGESSPKNTKQSYPIAMAEKRAKARCILQLVGFYKLGVYAETEAEDFKTN